MRPTPKLAALACALTLGGLAALGHLGRAGAQDESRPSRSARGGALAKTARHQFEVFFYDTGLRVFLLDAAGAPVDAAKVTATATFYHPNSPSPWFSRPLRPAATAGQALSLDLSIGLSKVPPSGAKVAFEVAGLSDPAETTATFTVPFEFVKTPSESTVAQPTTPAGSVTSSPRYVYGPGYYGYGYYRYPGPEAAPTGGAAPAVQAYSPPRRQHTSSGRDWSTGRDIPLAKPWTRPAD
jgi:hypothetical protein